MSQQGEQRSDQDQEDAWWSELYDKNQPDTGSAVEGDSLDERFTSVTAVVRSDTGSDPDPEQEPEPEPDRTASRSARTVRDGGESPPDRPAPPAGGLPSLSLGYGAPHTRGLPRPPELQQPPDQG
ncbi:hypothetical protein K6I34_006703, partial [Streptomyces sp. UNOC14_S4]|nr:hypothetical protein [Streptomyces sp. UNOC14_S4]